MENLIDILLGVAAVAGIIYAAIEVKRNNETAA